MWRLSFTHDLRRICFVTISLITPTSTIYFIPFFFSIFTIFQLFYHFSIFQLFYLFQFFQLFTIFTTFFNFFNFLQFFSIFTIFYNFFNFFSIFSIYLYMYALYISLPGEIFSLYQWTIFYELIFLSIFYMYHFSVSVRQYKQLLI
jgi:hypothetical protein